VRGGRDLTVEVALVWKWEAVLSSRALFVTSPNCALETPVTLEMAAADEGQDLPGLLQILLVSVERAIERVPLDALAFPCPRCRDEDVLVEDTGVVCGCQCVCQQQNQVEKKDTSIQTSPMFEFVGSIPHIDSDEENDCAHEPLGRVRSPDVASTGGLHRPLYRAGPLNVYFAGNVERATQCYVARGHIFNTSFNPFPGKAEIKHRNNFENL
jgi:hypothetical protein